MEEEPMYNNSSMQACTAACYGSFLETRGFLEAEGVTQSTDPSDLLEPTYTCSSTESAPSPGPLNPRGSSSDPRLSIDTPLLHADGGGSVARRNERERKRVRMVNMGFAKLRQYVPLATRGKRLSKVETLRSAIDYIRQLRQLLVYHQQYGEDPTPDCYHFYNIPHHAPHHPMMMSTMNPYHQFSGPAIGGYGVIGPAYAAEPTMDHGSVQSSWSVSSESPSPGLDTETASSPNGYGLLETETQVPCWTV